MDWKKIIKKNQIFFQESQVAVFHKILYDAVFLASVTFLGIVFIKTVAPGLIGADIPMMVLVWFIFAAVLAADFLRARFFSKIRSGEKMEKKFRLLRIIFAPIFIFLVVSAVFKIAWWQIILMTIFALSTLWFFWKIFFEKEEK